jgi:transposase-like protein
VQFNSVDELALPPFQNEEAAYRFVEECVWPSGPVCPHCGGWQHVGPLRGHSTRMGSYKCYECRKPFTVKVGTLFESSNLPMHKWLTAILLTTLEGKSIDANELHHVLNVSLRTASYILKRVRGESLAGLTSRLRRSAANESVPPAAMQRRLGLKQRTAC